MSVVSRLVVVGVLCLFGEYGACVFPRGSCATGATVKVAPVSKRARLESLEFDDITDKTRWQSAKVTNWWLKYAVRCGPDFGYCVRTGFVCCVETFFCCVFWLYVLLVCLVDCNCLLLSLCVGYS